DIIWRLARETRNYKTDIKKQTAEDLSTVCPTVLPIADKIGTKIDVELHYKRRIGDKGKVIFSYL
ncbi:MAG: hypothetical protein JRI72_14605, partial [Deltaproteobacteria bacterium]|nr:hypothetical protein [Deltaproteobacteria bacterium]